VICEAALSGNSRGRFRLRLSGFRPCFVLLVAVLFAGCSGSQLRNGSAPSASREVNLSDVPLSSLEELIATSDAIDIGKLISIESAEIRPPDEEDPNKVQRELVWLVFSVGERLKGNSADTIKVLWPGYDVTKDGRKTPLVVNGIDLGEHRKGVTFVLFTRPEPRGKVVNSLDGILVGNGNGKFMQMVRAEGKSRPSDRLSGKTVEEIRLLVGPNGK
jgi:hypothetical protein